MEKKSLRNFSLYFGFVVTLLGGMASNRFVWLLNIFLLAFFFMILYVSYYFLEKGVTWLYGRFIKNWYEEYRKFTRKKD